MHRKRREGWVRLAALGPLEVVDAAGEPIDVGGAQPRLVLAAQLSARGNAVSVDALIDALWRDDPPRSAEGTLQSYVSRLRRRLGNDAALLRDPVGYRLVVDADAVDFRRFEMLADQGRTLLREGRVADARRVLADGLALWRGPAFAEFGDVEIVATLARGLDELRLGAIDDRVAADLALGRHAAVIGEVTQLVAQHPLQESFRAHLALALYRAGRQADALRVLDDARRTLVDELGLDPGPALRELEAAILRHDPSLDLAGGLTAPASIVPSAPDAGDGDHGDDARAPLIGRDVELRDLLQTLEATRDATRVAIIEGEPGIGKTRLSEEIAAVAAAQGMLVLWGRAFEGAAAPSYWPWLAPLRSLVRSLPAEAPLPAPLAGLLEPSAADGVTREAEVARFGLFEAVAWLVTSVSQPRRSPRLHAHLHSPHVAPPEARRSLVDRLVAEPLLLVCTVRELEVGRNDAVVDALAALTRRPGTRRIRLRGLDEHQTAELIARTTGEQPDASVTAAVYARAEGNPFFTTELARLLAGGEGVADVPSGVRDVVRHRLSHLSNATTELLQVAAVIGRDIDLDLLARAAGRPFDACLDDLDPAVVHRLLQPVDDRPGTFQFSHALVREVLADDLSPLRRARLHLKVADALDAGDDDTAEIVAEHLWRAASIGVGRRAAEALERAARVAVRRLAYVAAEDLLERAVQLRRAAGSAGSTSANGEDDAARELDAAMQLVLVKASLLGYPALRGSQLLTRAMQLAERLDRTADLTNLLWIEWAGLDLARVVDRCDDVAAAILERTRDAESPAARIVGHTAFGIARWHRGDLLVAAEHLDTARSLASTLGIDRGIALFDRDAIRLSSAFAVYVHELIGDADDPDGGYQAAVDVLPGDRFWEMVVMNFAASAALSTGDLERVVRVAERGEAADPEAVSAFWSVALRLYKAAALCLLGDLDNGLPMLGDSWARYKAMGIVTNAPTWLASRAQALASAGRVDEATRALEEAQDVAAANGDDFAASTVLIAEATLQHARGEDSAVVRATLQRAADIATAQGAGALAARVQREAGALGLEVAVGR
jgi:DNA-binding SARP family transcriptional activator/tetratricopeptide (TPR) repeat protein